MKLDIKSRDLLVNFRIKKKGEVRVVYTVDSSLFMFFFFFLLIGAWTSMYSSNIVYDIYIARGQRSYLLKRMIYPSK